MLNLKKLFLLISVLIISMTSIVSYADESAGQYIKGSAITADVKTQLLTDSDIKSMHISVKTMKGVVTLTGTVVTEDQKTKAGQLAAQAKGVKSVTNKLVVKPAAK
jgi:hyperosmotically inducible protein